MKYDDHSGCLENHIIPLGKELVERGFDIWSEHGEPDQWVNINCRECGWTHEISLRQFDKRFDEDFDED